FDGLDRHEAHVRTNHRLADTLGIGRVVLVGLDEWSNVLGRDQPDVMAQTTKFARPVVATRARLNADESLGQSSKEHQDLRSAKSPPENAPSIDVGPVNLEYVLRAVEADHCGLGHVTSFGLPPSSCRTALLAVMGVGGPCHHVRRKFFDVHAANGSSPAK